MDIVSLHTIKATEDVHDSFEHKSLMESSGAWKRSSSYDSGPSLRIKVELINIVESFLVLINSTEYKHRCETCAS